MNQIRVALNKLPPAATIKILRKVFALPAPAARLILNDVTKPLSAHKLWIHKVAWNGEWSGCWIGEHIKHLDQSSLQKRIDDCDIILFNVHGGGFRIGTCTMYMATYISWIKVLKHSYGLEAMIMSVDYRLAPEFKYPSPVEDVVRAYESLCKKVDAGKIIVTGDSAGAALLLEMLFITHDPSMFEIVLDEKQEGVALAELPRPAGAVFISPLVTDETTSVSWKNNIKYDYISQYTAKVIKKDYFGRLGPDETNQILGIAKLETGFRSFLPEQVLMFVGEREVLLDDALDLAMRAERDGIQWETVAEDCVHDWFCVREVVKDKKILIRADAAFADFCYRALRRIPKMGMSARPLIDAHSSSYSSFRRSSEGLEMVLEEDEDSDYDTNDEFSDTDQESTAIYTANLGKKKYSSTAGKKEEIKTVLV
ncbi:hypothetical protein INT47_006413 [Mucor saturninus]|uniref:Alpha/beta hydrolase fold-3 domain-containing protein n=1 Tax=Mucor saturninus TaxID=64648 RepID=A0A8H7RIQ1_9FUNG|nr:hypothetical protein INT47_006413 [Mucor saturninus]